MNFLKCLYSPFEKRQKKSDPPMIFQLNHHCLYEIFEYLNVIDLHSFGQTCNRMNKVAGEYFKQNHASTARCLKKDGIHKYNYSKGDERTFQTPGFNKFIPYIRHINDNLRSLKYIKTHMNEFESIKHIYLRCIKPLNRKGVKYIEKLLPQLEILHIDECVVDGDFYDLILKYCKNLREIYVERSDVDFRTNGKINWLVQEYPKLELLHFIPLNSPFILKPKTLRIEELREFFVCNPSIRTFSTIAAVLLENIDIFLNSDFALDTLELKQLPYYPGKPRWNFFLELLNQLYEQGFYKRLHIQGGWDCLLTSVKGLELLCIQHYHMRSNPVQLTNLKELMLQYEVNAKDMEILANSLAKLQRLCIFGPNIDVLMPFIRRSMKLSKIKFIFSSKNEATLNLAKLNEERAKLFGAQKLTIYIRDDVFLATKWTTRNGDTNLSFIELRRSSSIKWKPDYYSPRTGNRELDSITLGAFFDYSF